MRHILLLALLALLGACAMPSATPAADGSEGTWIEPPVALTDFSMASSRGEPLGLADFAGQPTLIFFGFTFCPDVCPLTLSELKRVKEQLGADGAGLNVVFVSVDGERDTPEVLARYVESFDPSFVGLQGDTATLRQIGKDYGLYYEKREVEGTSAGYLVDHSSATYLVDAESNLRAIFSYGTEPEVIARGVERLLEE